MDPNGGYDRGKGFLKVIKFVLVLHLLTFSRFL